jgi:release factor glutamine methyltransferase
MSLAYEEYLEGTKEILTECKKELEKYYINILGTKFVVYPNVFSPKYFQDTEFFTKKIKINKDEKFLEIGPGTGVTVVFAALRGAKHVTAIDINSDAVKNTKENAKINGVADKVTVYEGDIYDPLPKGSKFDTIYWNTPFGYIDENKSISTLEKAVYDPGYKSTKRFVYESKKYLKSNGRLLIGFSTILGKFDILEKYLIDNGYSIKLIASKKSMEKHPVSFEIFEARL